MTEFNEFAQRMMAAQMRAPIVGSERRRFNIEMVCQGATIAEMKSWMDAAFGVQFPAKAKRAEVVATVIEFTA